MSWHGSTRLPTFVVDAFSSRPFGGNPAAVCLLAPGVQLSDDMRQRIAAEMNHSETAFVEPLEATGCSETQGGPGSDVFSTGAEFRLRWFTPSCEVPCCGHATLAAAAVLLQACGNPQPTITFHTLSGELCVSRANNTTPATVSNLTTTTPTTSVTPATSSASAAASPLVLSLTLPLYDPVDAVPACAADPAGRLLAACVGDLPVEEVRYCGTGGLNYVLVVLRAAAAAARAGGEGGGDAAKGADEAALRALRPDFGAMLAAATAEEVHGVIVCVRSRGSPAGTEGPDGAQAPQHAGVFEAADVPEVCSRFFAPWLGINEDPVTGSAHAVLGPYWEPLLRPTRGSAQEPGPDTSGLGSDVTKSGSSDHSGGPMRMRQCSARGGEVAVEMLRSAGRVRVSGPAALVLEGWLTL